MNSSDRPQGLGQQVTMEQAVEELWGSELRPCPATSWPGLSCGSAGHRLSHWLPSSWKGHRKVLLTLELWGQFCFRGTLRGLSAFRKRDEDVDQLSNHVS